ncbi:MAG: hypothetical protein HRF40_08075 [Nitrososphaera sp.]
MQASIANTTKKRVRSAFVGNHEFVIHASLLGGFVGLVGYLAAICNHIH